MRSSLRWGRRHVLGLTAVVALAAAGVAGAVGTRSAVAPASSSLPSIGGTAAVGSTVTANPGTWTGSAPITYQYQWLICGADGNACRDIAGATSQTYKFASGDLGNTARVRVIASNADGSATATSGPTARIAAATATGPVSTALPSVTGDAAIGSTLSASNGSWTGTQPIAYKYQWRVCGAVGEACRDIPGATSPAYTLI